VEQFADDLEAHGGCADNVQDVCIDMSASYRAGVQEHLPSATITFDEFHVVQLLTKTADGVRRAEVKQVSELKRSRYPRLEDKRKWARQQVLQHADLSRMNLKTHRAPLASVLGRPNPCSTSGTLGTALPTRTYEAGCGDHQNPLAENSQCLRLKAYQRQRRSS